MWERAQEEARKPRNMARTGLFDIIAYVAMSKA